MLTNNYDNLKVLENFKKDSNNENNFKIVIQIDHEAFFSSAVKVSLDTFKKIELLLLSNRNNSNLVYEIGQLVLAAKYDENNFKQTNEYKAICGKMEKKVLNIIFKKHKMNF